MACKIEINTVEDIFRVTEEIARQLRNGHIPEVTIKIPRDQKTAKQRAYYYGGIIAGALKHDVFADVTKEELEDVLLDQASTGRIQIGSKVDIPKRKRISAMNTEEMSYLIDVSLHWLSAEFGIYIDTPAEYFARQYKTQNERK